jgi:hypothetical protein
VIQAVDAFIAAVAGRQRGYISRAQLLGLGLDDAAIHYRVMVGRLHRVHHGVYAVGVASKDIVDRAAAAVLACGDHAALSHGSGIALWAFHPRWRWQAPPFEVTTRTARRRPGIEIHRSRSLDWRDITVHHGIRVTKPARTILDHASALNDRDLTRLVNDALISPYLTDNALPELLARVPTHPSAARLAPFIERKGGPTRSHQEDDFPGFCARYGVPEPIMNAIVYGFEVDAWFPDSRLVVQLDGWQFHRSREAFESDRDLDATLLDYEIETIRLTKRRATQAPVHEAKRLQRILHRRRLTPA